MARKESPKNSDSHVNLFEEQKRSKKTALEVLEIAKEEEKQKLKMGFQYVTLDDGKTKVLRINQI